jgi:hypothetical protein
VYLSIAIRIRKHSQQLIVITVAITSVDIISIIHRYPDDRDSESEALLIIVANIWSIERRSERIALPSCPLSELGDRLSDRALWHSE